MNILLQMNYLETYGPPEIGYLHRVGLRAGLQTFGLLS